MNHIQPNMNGENPSHLSTSPKKVDGLSHSSRSVGYWPPDTTDTAGWMTDTAGRRFFRTSDVVELMPEGDLVGDGAVLGVHPSASQ